MGVPLSSLALRFPEQQLPNALDTYAKAMRLRQMQQEAPLRQQALQQNVQAGAQDIAAKQDQLATQQATRAAYAKAVKPNAQGQPEIDTEALTQNLANSGHGDAIPGILENVTKFQKSKADLQESQQKIQTYNQDTLGYAASAIQKAKYDPNVAHTLLDTLPSTPQIQALRQQIDSNPQQFKQIVDNAVSQSPAQQKAAEEEKVATIRAQGKPPEGELPLPNVDQMNSGLKTRYQVLNPGKPLPDQFTLPANATQKDYDRIDKLMQSTENATATKAQRDTANAARASQQGTNQQFTKDDPLVQAVAGGKMKLTEALTPRTPISVRRQFVDAVHDANPDFDTKSYDIEKGVDKAFTSGQYSQQLNSINRAREHMGTFLQMAQAQDNGDIPALNKIRNVFKTQFGSDTPGNLDIAKQAFASEVGKSFAGSSVALADREELGKSIDKASSWTQLSGAARTADTLLAGAQKALKQTYEAGKSGKPNFGDQSSAPSSSGKPTNHPFFESLGGQVRPQ